MNKQDLIQKLKKLGGLSADEKAALINLVNTKKKYGLVWEDKIEGVEEQLREKLPVLKEVKDKAIINGDAHPNHILIEGDNLHALTALTFTHEGMIDVIYIDPPYNTGNKDFKYNDSFVDKEDSYRHSKWLSFMSKRLAISKRLLSDKGIIFISIDDNEQAQLKLLCDEIFTEGNNFAKFIWRTDGNFDNQAQVKNCHEYILAYSKLGERFKVGAVIDPNVNDDSKLFNDNIQNTIVKNGPKNPISEVLLPSGFPCLFEFGSIKKRDDKFPYYLSDVEAINYATTNSVIVKSGWSSKALLELYIKNDFQPVLDTKNQLTEFKISQTGSIEAIKVRADQSHVISVLMNMGNTQSNSNKLAEMGIKFSYPKPVSLIKYLSSIIPSDNYTILDFFAGSGTTLHATMELNSESGGSRRCILITNNENNICEEVTYQRNKKVICGYTNLKGIKEGGLQNNNLRYFRSDLVSREPSLKHKRELTLMAAELLAIKENCYDDITPEFLDSAKWAKILTNSKGKMVFVVLDEIMIEDAITMLKKLMDVYKPSAKIKVYVFSNGHYPYTEDFEDVISDIELCALPDAIYKAYQNVLPSRTRNAIPEIEEPTAKEVEADLEHDLFNEAEY